MASIFCFNNEKLTFLNQTVVLFTVKSELLHSSIAALAFKPSLNELRFQTFAETQPVPCGPIIGRSAGVELSNLLQGPLKLEWGISVT